jgi:hypothetical protein
LELVAGRRIAPVDIAGWRFLFAIALSDSEKAIVYMTRVSANRRSTAAAGCWVLMGFVTQGTISADFLILMVQIQLMSLSERCVGLQQQLLLLP